MAKKSRASKSRSQLTKADIAAIKEEQAGFIEKIRTAHPNEHQQAIFVAAQSGYGRYVVLAGPGSGKTFTSIKASTSFSGRSVYFSYNKKIQIDTNNKLVAIDSPMVATTAHAFGLSCLIAFTRGSCNVDDKEEKYSTIIKQYMVEQWGLFAQSIQAEFEEDEDADIEVMRLDAFAWSKILIHYAQVSLTPPTPAGLSRLVDEFDLSDISRASLVWDFVTLAVSYAIEEGQRQFLGPTHLVSFDDMIYLPNVIAGVPVRQYDHVIVDEAQDTSRASLELMLKACHKNSQVFFVGDKKQCQPAGTMVRLQNGEESPIECLRPGSKVVTFDRRSAAFVKSGVVSEVATRPYNGPLYTVTAGGKQSRCTDSHKWLVRWIHTDRPVWVTYLMKKGERYRVGQAQLFNTVEGRANFGLGIRARVERADAAWILKVHDSLESALTHEAIVVARYGLPQIVFNPVWNNTHFTQEAINCVYDELLPLEEKARRCLEDHGRRLKYPLYMKTGMSGYNEYRQVNTAGDQQRQGRTTFFETQACNLISEYMAVPVAPEVIANLHKKLEWQAVTVTSESYSGSVYSLNVERYHKYIADGLVTCNSIYAFAGAAFDSIDQIIDRLDAETLPLRICYRCGSRIVDLANQLCAEDEKLISAGLHQGTVEVIKEYVDRLRAGDAVIGRTRKKLVQGCLKALQMGKKAKVLGRDIGNDITGVVTRLEAKRIRRGIPALQPDLSNLLQLLEEHKATESKSLQESRKNPEMALSELEDKVETVRAFFEAYTSKCYDETLRVPEDPQCAFNRTAKDFKAYIHGLFSDDDNAKDFILFMTAHRSKGGEWENVYIIGTDEFPHPKAKSERQQEQESNLMYVAITRAIEKLFFVGAPFNCVTVSGYEPDQQRGLTIVSFPAADHLEVYPRDADRETVEPSVSSALGFKDLSEVLGLEETVSQGNGETVIDATAVVMEPVEEPLAEGRVSRIAAIEVLCPACNNPCMDRVKWSPMITYDLIGHSVECSSCHKMCIVPLNAFSLQGNVVAREKPAGQATKREKKGRTQKERKSKAGRKTKGKGVRQPMQLSLDLRVINTLNAMGVNKSELFEELLQQYEPFLDAWSELGNDEFTDEEDDEE